MALISKIHPDGSSHVRTVIPSIHARLFSALDTGDGESAKIMELTITAYRTGTQELLVKAKCTVDPSALVLDLSLIVLGPARLEQLTLSQLRLTH